MIRVNWDLEEAVALFDIYFNSGSTMNVEDATLIELSNKYKKRAEEKELVVDEKFRNLTGLKMQIGCIHYVVTDGREGLSNASKLFYDTYELYKSNPQKFHEIAEDFYRKYA
jgi:hypothetical protein